MGAAMMVVYMLSKLRSVIMGDEVGLGKSYEWLLAAYRVNQIRRMVAQNDAGSILQHLSHLLPIDEIIEDEQEIDEDTEEKGPGYSMVVMPTSAIAGWKEAAVEFKKVKAFEPFQATGSYVTDVETPKAPTNPHKFNAWIKRKLEHRGPNTPHIIVLITYVTFYHAFLRFDNTELETLRARRLENDQAQGRRKFNIVIYDDDGDEEQFWERKPCYRQFSIIELEQTLAAYARYRRICEALTRQLREGKAKGQI
jgi:hypothetical protein